MRICLFEQEQQIARDLSTCETIVENHLHLLGDVVRASWNKSAEEARLKSKCDLYESHALMCKRLSSQVHTNTHTHTHTHTQFTNAAK